MSRTCRGGRLPVLVLLLATVAAACGGDDDDDGGTGTTAPGTSTTTGAQPLPDADQVLTVATPGDVFITRERVHLGIWPDNANICETLVGLSEDFQPVPLLATSWELMGDNTFRFELRRDVTFHDGTPFTAEAVEHSFRRIVEKRATLTSGLGPDSVTVVDDHTVDVTPTEPNLRLPEQITHPFFSIVAPGTDPADEPVCTGPFEFGSYTPNDRLVADRYEGYWGEPARLRQLVLRFVPDQNTRRLALESGDVDIAYFLPPQTAADVRSRDGFEIAPATGAVATMSLNLHGEEPHTLLQDADVRRALALSLDPEALAEDQWQGTAEVVTTVSPPSILGSGASSVPSVTGDPSEAADILDQAGWAEGSDGIREKDGRTLSLAMVAQFDFEPESLQFLQAQAREVGIDLRIETLPDAAAYSARINAGTFDVDVNYFNQNDANPARIVAQFWSERAGSARVGFTGPGGEFETVVDEALLAPDTAAAAAKAVEANEVLVSDVSAIPLTTFPQIFGYNTTVAGFSPHPSVNHQPWTAVYLTG